MQPEVLSRDPLPVELSLDRVKNYCRVYGDEHDTTLQLIVDAAVEFVQGYTRQVFRPAQYRQVSDVAAFSLARFPVQSVDLIEVGDGEAWTAHSGHQLTTTQPPMLCLTAPVPAEQYRVTYTAGHSEWPADLILLVLQMTEENFENRGVTPVSATAVKFSRAHELALEQHASHVDAARWV